MALYAFIEDKQFQNRSNKGIQGLSGREEGFPVPCYIGLFFGKDTMHTL